MRLTLSKKELKKAVSDYVKTHYDDNLQISDIFFSNFERYVSVGEIDLVVRKKPGIRNMKNDVEELQEPEIVSEKK